MSIIGERPDKGDFPEIPEAKKRKKNESAGEPLKERVTKAAKKGPIGFEDEVTHTQIFESPLRSGRVRKRTKERTIPLVDESSNTSSPGKADISQEQAEEKLKRQKEEINEWKKEEPKLRPRGMHPVGQRQDRQLTEKSLSKRAEGMITKRSSSWKEPDLGKLFSSAIKALKEAGLETSRPAIRTQMIIEAHLSQTEVVTCTFEELKEIYTSLNLDILYHHKATEDSPGTPPNILSSYNIPEVEILSTLMKDIADIVAINKNKDGTYAITHSKISEKEIDRYLNELQRSQQMP